jgi:malonate transporter
MTALLDVILPVFILIGAGWLAAKRGIFTESVVDGVMSFSQNFAVPCLLFKSIATLDLAAAYQPGLLISFYVGAFAGFAAGFCGARYYFHRPLAESVAIGFACLFSNSLLLGLPITERAYGTAALAGNFAIVSMHAPLLYGFGICLMEVVNSRETGIRGGALARQVLRTIFAQPLVLGISAGLVVNLTGLPLPGVVNAAIDMLARTGIPAALFALGGVLLRYSLQGDRGLVALVCLGSLVVHPVVSYGLGRWGFHLDPASLRSSVVTSAMPPGVNAYLFAHLYGTGRKVNAASVLVATGLALGTTWIWLQILP